MSDKVVVPYAHRERDTQMIHLAVTSHKQPTPDEWKPALRDVIDGQRVVWAPFPTDQGNVWLRDRDGERQVRAGSGRAQVKPAAAPRQAAPPRQTTPRPEADLPETWSAALVAPMRAVRHDSRESLVVRVEAPVWLTDQRALIGLESHDGGQTVWGSATWAGAPGPRRNVTASFGARPLAVAPGWYRVLVRVSTFDQAPTLDAGAVAVS